MTDSHVPCATNTRQRQKQLQRRRQRRCARRAAALSSLLIPIVYCTSGASDARPCHLRLGEKRRNSALSRRQTTEHHDANELACPPSYNGYYPTPGCRRYFWCQGGSPFSDAVYSCTIGLLFDEALGMCNWKNEVNCTVVDAPSLDEQVWGNSAIDYDLVSQGMASLKLESEPTVMPATGDPTGFTFRKRTPPHGKEIIGYWHGNTARASGISPDRLDYSKLTRVNYATYTADEDGSIYMKDGQGTINDDADIDMLLGPVIWDASMSESGTAREYCHFNPTTDVLTCNQQKYTQGMLYLAHRAGAEVYPSVSLDLHQSMPRLDKEKFAENAVRLLEEYEFDGIDVNFSKLTAAHDVEALQALLSTLRREVVKLMYKHKRHYGLTAAVPCHPGEYDAAELDRLVDELNLLSVDLNTARSSNIVEPQAPLFTDPSHGGEYSVHGCVNHWLASGVSQERINLGLSFSGRTYRGASELYVGHQGPDLVRWIDTDSNDGSIPYYGIYPRITGRSSHHTDSLTSIRHDLTKSQYAYFSNNNMGEGMLVYDNEQSLCDKAEYGLANKLNGYFIWEITGDILDDDSTPLLDAVNLKLAQPGLDCEFIGEEETAQEDGSPIDKFEMIVNGETVVGQYGPPKYYPDFTAQSCGEDELTKPMWVTEKQMYSSKRQCCKEIFDHINLNACLGGEGFVETNFIRDPTHSPSAAPSIWRTLSPSSEPTSAKPTTTTPSTSPVKPVPTQYPTQPGYGRCASSESGLSRRSQPCSDKHPCQKGEQCFSGIDFGSDAVGFASISEKVQPAGTPNLASDVVSSVHPMRGLCATDLSELPQVFRVALPCSTKQPCPAGLQCFHDVNFSSVQSLPSKKPTIISAPTAPGIAIQAEETVTLFEDNPLHAHGFEPTLIIDGRPGHRRDVLLKFDISLLDTFVSVESASLRLYATEGSGHCGTLVTAKNLRWDEGSATWASVLDYASNEDILVGQASAVVSNEWLNMDVTWALQWVRYDQDRDWRFDGNKYLSLRASSTIDNRCTFSSSNGTPSRTPHLWISLNDKGGERTMPQATPSNRGISSGDASKSSNLLALAEKNAIPVAPSDGAVTKPVLSTSSGDRGITIKSSASIPTSKAISAPTPSPVAIPEGRVQGEALLLRAMDDATVVKEKPEENFGKNAILAVDGDGGESAKDILIRFDLKLIHKTMPKRAVLGLYVIEDCKSAGIFTTTSRYDEKFEEMEDDHWNEDDVVWSNAPSYHRGKYGGGSFIGTFGNVQGGKWFGFDVLTAFSWDLVNRQRMLTFRVSSDGGERCMYASIQDGKAAKLMFEF